MSRERFTIRRLAPIRDSETGVWQSIRDLCCRTGNNGDPIDPEQWDFFPRVWIDPYEKLIPEWTYVAEAGSTVIAYLTGCPDTAKFAPARFFYCTLPLIIEIGCGRYRKTPNAARFARQALGLLKKVEDYFPREIRRRIKDQYPAHLHVNVDTPFRSLGVGRRLIESYSADLHAKRVSGVHVYCGSDPVGFYVALGFQKLGSVVFHGTEVHALGSLVSPSVRVTKY